MATPPIKQGSRFTPDLSSLATVSRTVERWLLNRKPGSLIRIGDGEGMVLARPSPADRVLWRHMMAHFGPEITEPIAATLAEQVTAAISNSDFVGVRTDLLDVDFPVGHFDQAAESFVAKFKELFPLRRAEQDIQFAGALRLANTHRFLATYPFESNQRFCSAWIHFELAPGGVLQHWLSTGSRVGLISSRSTLQRALEQRFGTTIDFFRVPDMYASAKANGQPYDYSTLERTRDQLKVVHSGQLFLVGAGVWGKVYCDRIKQLGGIGIDIGAVCDAWLGLSTRPLVYQSMFGTDGNVPGLLKLDLNDPEPG